MYDPHKTALAVFGLDEPWRTNFLEYIISTVDGRWKADRLPTPEELRRLFVRSERLCRLTAELYCRWTRTPPSRLWRIGEYRK